VEAHHDERGAEGFGLFHPADHVVSGAVSFSRQKYPSSFCNSIEVFIIVGRADDLEIFTYYFPHSIVCNADTIPKLSWLRPFFDEEVMASLDLAPDAVDGKLRKGFHRHRWPRSTHPVLSISFTWSRVTSSGNPYTSL